MALNKLVKIRIIGDLLEGTERYYEGPTTREALLAAAQDWVCCGHYRHVKEAFRFLKGVKLYEIVQ